MTSKTVLLTRSTYSPRKPSWLPSEDKECPSPGGLKLRTRCPKGLPSIGTPGRTWMNCSHGTAPKLPMTFAATIRAATCTFTFTKWSKRPPAPHPPARSIQQPPPPAVMVRAFPFGPPADSFRLDTKELRSFCACPHTCLCGFLVSISPNLKSILWKPCFFFSRKILAVVFLFVCFFFCLLHSAWRQKGVCLSVCTPEAGMLHPSLPIRPIDGGPANGQTPQLVPTDARRPLTDECFRFLSNAVSCYKSSHSFLQSCFPFVFFCICVFWT